MSHVGQSDHWSQSDCLPSLGEPPAQHLSPLKTKLQHLMAAASEIYTFCSEAIRINFSPEPQIDGHYWSLKLTKSRIFKSPCEKSLNPMSQSTVFFSSSLISTSSESVPASSTNLPLKVCGPPDRVQQIQWLINMLPTKLNRSKRIKLAMYSVDKS